MNVSLDLRIGREPTEQGDGDWLRIGEDLHRDFNRRAEDLSLMIHGRTIYEIMEPFWPAAADDPSLPDFLQEYGRIWTKAPKILVSRSRTEAGHNTRVVGGDDAIDQLASIISNTEGTIGVGGAGVATQLLQRGLLDELLLYTHPVVLGAGRPLFNAVDQPVECDLLESAAFPDGVVMHRWRVRR